MAAQNMKFLVCCANGSSSVCLILKIGVNISELSSDKNLFLSYRLNNQPLVTAKYLQLTLGCIE